jgi:hypothetical protein
MLEPVPEHADGGWWYTCEVEQVDIGLPDGVLTNRPKGLPGDGRGTFTYSDDMTRVVVRSPDPYVGVDALDESSGVVLGQVIGLSERPYGRIFGR